MQILRDVNLHVGDGEVVALLGRSGAGKSTILHIIAGLMDVGELSGQAWVDQIDMVSASAADRAAARRSSIGVVFQFAELVAELSLLENVALPLRFGGVRRAEAMEAAETVCSELGLDREVSDRRPGEVSGGQAQRAAVARALIGTPRVLLCDEPTGALDSETGQETMSLIAESTKRLNLSTLVVTHSGEVAAFADRVLAVRDGQISESTGLVASPTFQP